MIHVISDRTHVEEALRESERRLAQSQKMEAVGQLTVRSLLTSGCAEELVHGDDLPRERLKVLRKPYQPADLVAALRAILNAQLLDRAVLLRER
jgi:hypothetical protein